MKYPYYSELENVISTHSEFLQNWHSYSDLNHQRMKQIFNMLFLFGTEDKKLNKKIKTIGEDIIRYEGLVVMKDCYNIFTLALLLIYNESKGSKRICKKLSSLRDGLNEIWHEIDEWDLAALDDD